MIDLHTQARNFVQNAQKCGVIPYHRQEGSKMVIRDGAIAIWKDFGDVLECNREPIATKLVLLRERTPHTLYVVEAQSCGRVRMTPEGVASMIYPATFEVYARKFADSHMHDRRMEVEIIGSFNFTAAVD